MKICTFFIFLLLQLPAREQQSDTCKSFSGLWHHAESNRDIRILAEQTDNTKYIIYDSTRDKKGKMLGSEDIYPAFLKDDKLVMPASHSPRCPYCEIQQKQETLLYICNSPLDIQSNVLRIDQQTDTVLFYRKH